MRLKCARQVSGNPEPIERQSSANRARTQFQPSSCILTDETRAVRCPLVAPSTLFSCSPL
jgi:hypothetical protein